MSIERERLLRDSHDDGIGSLQVETETSSSSGKDEDLVGRVGGVKLGDEICSVVGLGGSIESKKAVSVSSVDEVVLEDVHDVDHLEEHEDLGGEWARIKEGREERISREFEPSKRKSENAELEDDTHSMIGSEKLGKNPVEKLELS